MTWKYVGELDEKSKMCGRGVKTYSDGVEYTGTFYDDLYHGIGVQSWSHLVYEGEYKAGKRHGRSTNYMRHGDVFNMTYKDGTRGTSTKVDEPSEAWYGDGKPIE